MAGAIVASAAASSLISALSKKETVKSTANLGKAVGGINEAQKSGGLDSLNGVFSQMKSMPAFIAPMDVLMGKIQAGTTQSSIELMNEMFEFLESEAGKDSISLLIVFLNIIINNFSKWGDAANAAARYYETFKNIVTKSDEAVVSLNTYGEKMDALTGKFANANKELEELGISVDDVGGEFISLKTTLKDVEETVVEVIESISTTVTAAQGSRAQVNQDGY